MSALYALFLVLAAAWTAYAAYEDRYDQDLMWGRICMSLLLGGLSLPSFLPALALPLILMAVGGLGGALFFSRRVYSY
jgi:hypothetical protein